MHLNRSLLFMPVSNTRAMDKATSLPVDTVILDLEDSVAADVKANQTDLVRNALARDFGHRRCLLRINAIDSPYWQDDIKAVLQALANGGHCDGVVLPKVESVEQIDQCVEQLGQAANLGIWIMIETAAGLQRAAELCHYGKPVAAVIVGTADLALDLGLPDPRFAERHCPQAFQPVQPRSGLLHSLSTLVTAARAAGIIVVDGVYPDFSDAEGFEREAWQGLQLGFDGKSLIHPAQLEATHRVFTPSAEEIAEAREMIDAWHAATGDSGGVFSYKNAMVEELHIRQANARIAIFEAAESADSGS